MNKDVSQDVVVAAIQAGNFVLAAKSCTRLAQAEKNNPELWQMAAQLSIQAALDENAANCYAHAARQHAVKQQHTQAMRMFDHYADLHHNRDKRSLCRYLFTACRHGGCEKKLCSGDIDPVCHIFREDPFWSNQPPSAISMLLKSCRLLHYRQGDYLAKAGDISNSIYLVVKGIIRPEIHCEQCAPHTGLIYAGGLCGDLPFHLGLEQHVFSFQAMKDSLVIEIPHLLLQQLLKTYENFRGHVQKVFDWHFREHFIACIPFFTQLEEKELTTISSQLTAQRRANGAILFEQGSPENLDMLIIKSGWCSINYLWKNKEHHLCTLKAGDICGELGVLTGVRQVTVRAITDVELLYWPETSFRQAFKCFYSIRDHVKASFSRYQQAMENIHQHERNPLNRISQINHDELLKDMYCRHLLHTGT